MDGHVFISYCNADRSYVERLAAYLASAGLPVWYDYELHVGDHLSLTIQDQISRCSAVIAVLTPQATHSDWVRLELSFAHRSRKPMYPLLLRPCRLPLLVSDLYYDDVTGGALPSADFLGRVSRAQAKPDRPDSKTAAPVASTQPTRPASPRRRLLRWATAALASTVALTGSAVALTGSTVASGATNANTNTAAAVIGVDLPFKGPAQAISEQIVQALELYLDQIGGRVGNTPVSLRKYDSTGPENGWDSQTCRTNALAHAASADEVAVLGPFDAGCANIETAMLNLTGTGPMLTVSYANGDADRTLPVGTQAFNQYYPSGSRNYLQVFPTDDEQGVVAADFAAEELGVTRCFVLNDGDQSSLVQSESFATEAKKQQLAIVGSATWNPTDTDYLALFAAVDKTHPDCVYLAGSYNNNGMRLITDKAHIGDNTTVKLLLSNGFAGHGRLDRLAQATDAYVVSPGADLDRLPSLSTNAASFMSAFQSTYGTSLASPFPLYAVQALQVIVAAIRQSGHSRADIRDAIFGTDGVTVAATDAILGAGVRISPSTGDVSVKDFSIRQITGGEENLVEDWRLSADDPGHRRTSCPQVTIDAVRAHQLPGNLELLRYIETSPAVPGLPANEIWICRDTDGALYYQSHQRNGPMNVATGDGSILLGAGVRGMVKTDNNGFVAVSPHANGDITYVVTPTMVCLLEPDGAQTTYQVIQTYPD